MIISVKYVDWKRMTSDHQPTNKLTNQPIDIEIIHLQADEKNLYDSTRNKNNQS